RHKAVVDRFISRGVVLGIGPFTDGGNMAIFKTREEAEAFSREDPFILEGLVKSFVIKEWRDSLLPEGITPLDIGRLLYAPPCPPGRAAVTPRLAGNLLLYHSTPVVKWSDSPERGRGQRRRSRRVIRVSCCATRWPEPPPRPAPGWVEAPMCQRSRICVACREPAGSGRQRRFWSSSAEPPYGSPATALGLWATRSLGVTMSTESSFVGKSGACLATRASTRRA